MKNNKNLTKLLEKSISNCAFREVFIKHLRWDRFKGKVSDVVVNVDKKAQKFPVTPIAQKRNFTVFHIKCHEMPIRSVRKEIETKLSNERFKHILILESDDGTQIWIQTVNKNDGKEELVETNSKPIAILVNNLLDIAFTINEEPELNLSIVSSRAAKAFSQNTEAVTARFYAGFSDELEKFSGFIEGIEEMVDKEYYSSVMLNRLMFVYFIQKKGYLDGDIDYMRTRFHKVREEFGENKFYGNFYRHFLTTLFHRGLGGAQSKRDAKVNKMIGNVPYLNGGLFDEHRIETEYKSNINIMDSAFISVFDFFDKFQWVLDSREGASGKEINPDVIGHIFEKYINKKATDKANKGAYYTKEDITGYIARNTIIPALLQKAKEQCKEAFDPQGGIIWKLLRDNPVDYIYPSVGWGCNIPDSKLPKNIQMGLNLSDSDLLLRRADWNGYAKEEFALPGESWRDVVARRQRYFALKKKIKSNGITNISDLTTNNLDIEKLIVDAIAQHEGTGLLSAIYFAIAGQKKYTGDGAIRRGLTVLDPACGSGAFLFAALNVLRPLYEICIKRMDELVNDEYTLPKKRPKHLKTLNEYHDILDEIKNHPNRRYWVCRNIILYNLFGVDIMPGAAEVAKLRLFLKLAAESKADDAKQNMGLDPLPDIDFNIRAGNSLVGFSSIEGFEKSAGEESVLIDLSGGLIDDIRAEAKDVGIVYGRFIDAQSVNGIGGEVFRKAKRELVKKSTNLSDKLNKYLAQIYGVDCNKNKDDFAEWKRTHAPFHWVSEFYDIMKSGGFDVIIGNPPFVEKWKVNYKLINFSNAKGNLFAFLVEKSLQVLQSGGIFGMIVPISLPSTNRMENLRTLLTDRFPVLYAANFADRPDPLFNGVHQKVTVVMGHAGESGGFYTTNYLHWRAKNERDNLFNGLHYQSNGFVIDRWQKFGNAIDTTIWQKIQKSERMQIFHKTRTSDSDSFYINKRLMYWVKSCVLPKKSDEFCPYAPLNKMPREAVVAMLNSSVYFWFWEIVGDGWHLTEYELGKFNFGVKKEDIKLLANLGKKLEKDLEDKKKYVNTKQTDYEYRHARSKDIIDEIDKTIAKYYGFTEEELDYIINYTYKYRMSEHA